VQQAVGFGALTLRPEQQLGPKGNAFIIYFDTRTLSSLSRLHYQGFKTCFIYFWPQMSAIYHCQTGLFVTLPVTLIAGQEKIRFSTSRTMAGCFFCGFLFPFQFLFLSGARKYVGKT